MSLRRRLIGSLALQPGEQAAVAWAFFYFFCLLSSYYLLRPLRDEMGIQAGVDQLQWLFTATFIVMMAAVPVFGYASARWPRPMSTAPVWPSIRVLVMMLRVFTHRLCSLRWQ